MGVRQLRGEALGWNSLRGCATTQCAQKGSGVGGANDGSISKPFLAADSRPPHETLSMTYDIHRAHLPSHPLAVVRRRAWQAELAKVVPEACGIVWNALRSQGVGGAGRHVAVYLDDQINLEVGVELDA